MFCRKCGKPLNDDDVFCASCGARVLKAPDGAGAGVPQANEPKKELTEFEREFENYKKLKPTWRNDLETDGIFYNMQNKLHKGIKVLNVFENILMTIIVALAIHLLVWFIALHVPGGLSWRDFGGSTMTALYLIGVCFIIIGAITGPINRRMMLNKIRKQNPPIDSLMYLDSDKSRYSISSFIWSAVIYQYSPSYRYLSRVSFVARIQATLIWTFAFPVLAYNWITWLTYSGFEFSIEAIGAIIVGTFNMPLVWIFAVPFTAFSIVNEILSHKEEKVIKALEEKWNADLKQESRNALIDQLKELQEKRAEEEL